MNPLDVGLIAILVVSLLYSTWRGFVRDVLSIVGILGGILLAARFYSDVAALIRPWVDTQWLAALLACGGIFLVTCLGVSLVGKMASRSLRLLNLGWLDRAAGTGFGLLKAVVISAGLVIALVSFLPPRSPILSESRIAPVLLHGAKEAGKRIPGKVGEWLSKIKVPEREDGTARQGRRAKKDQ